ncbi:Uncharacterized protein YbiU [Hypsizygus marmoreus]|uniref:Uncharacterized protein YbiU n=1 Tax=Hypsizygus marmoreus TaxID=39966 RepID=A0A369JFL1_HYPMA|nr:Uncharacterized protein YbiU [Hypsizygus marmoreus]
MLEASLWLHYSSTMIRTWRFPGALSVGSSRVSHYASPKARSMMSGRQTTLRPPKEEGSISSIFTSLTGETPAVLPPRFSTLKKEIWRDEMIESWREVLNELEEAVEEVSSRGSEMIPRISYTDIHNGLSKEQIGSVKRTGTIIVKGGVPREVEALTWKQSIRYYALANQDSVRGFPADNIQVYELYNSIGQVKARSHPALVETQKFLLSLWHASDPSTASEISLSTPISYFDRLRIRQPGDSKFALGPHIDGGALERWEDPGFRSCFKRILQGGNWRQHDPFDVTPRIHAKQDLYHASNQCSIFRPWQGWTSMSSTGPNEGTLRVLPLLTLSSAYIMLRPFFRPRSAHSTSLNFEDWEVDIDGTSFPGSGMGKTQELNETTHPHLRLDKMVSMPRVEPGDQVYWHCDVVHAVETQHRGLSDSSVLYIPAVPLTLNNASYLRDQRLNFVAGLPAPDFPGGEGESKFVGHASVDDLATQDARRMFGFEKFEDGISKDANFAKKVNSILFG